MLFELATVQLSGMNEMLTRKQFRECEICAYHESGHILFAYLCGYACQYVELIDENNEEGYTSIAVIDYGKDADMASRFTSGEVPVDYFQCLALGEKLESLEVGRRLARIFLGGSVAAAVYHNKGNVQIPLPMQIDYLDLLRVEFIHTVIQELSTEKEEGFIENGLHEALYTLANINVWETVSDLAQRLLDSRQLNKNDIEECLEEHGLMPEGMTS